MGNADAIVERAEAAGLTPILDISDTPSWAYPKKPQGVNAGTPKAAALGRVRDGARDALRRREPPDRSAGRPRLPGLERGQQQPLPRPRSARPTTARWSTPSPTPCTPSTRRTSSSPATSTRSGTRRARSRSGTRRRRSPSCARCSASRRERIRTRPAARTIHFDVWSHHPYTFNGPFGHARNPDDVSLGDLPKMRALLQAGVKLHRVVSTARGQVLGDGVQLGHEPATPPCRAQLARGALDGRGASTRCGAPASHS